MSDSNDGKIQSKILFKNYDLDKMIVNEGNKNKENSNSFVNNEKKSQIENLVNTSFNSAKEVSFKSSRLGGILNRDLSINNSLNNSNVRKSVIVANNTNSNTNINSRNLIIKSSLVYDKETNLKNENTNNENNVKILPGIGFQEKGTASVNLMTSNNLNNSINNSGLLGYRNGFNLNQSSKFRLRNSIMINSNNNNLSSLNVNLNNNNLVKNFNSFADNTILNNKNSNQNLYSSTKTFSNNMIINNNLKPSNSDMSSISPIIKTFDRKNSLNNNFNNLNNISNLNLSRKNSLNIFASQNNTPQTSFKKFTYKIQGRDEMGNEVLNLDKRDPIIAQDLDNSTMSESGKKFFEDILFNDENGSQYGSDVDEVEILLIIN